MLEEKMAAPGKYTVQYRQTMTFKSKALGNFCMIFLFFPFFLCMSTAPAGYQHYGTSIVAGKYGVLNRMKQERGQNHKLIFFFGYWGIW